jgi:hypothetical protein
MYEAQETATQGSEQSLSAALFKLDTRSLNFDLELKRRFGPLGRPAEEEESKDQGRTRRGRRCSG